jgi:hypothetical protein
MESLVSAVSVVARPAIQPPNRPGLTMDHGARKEATKQKGCLR